MNYERILRAIRRHPELFDETQRTVKLERIRDKCKLRLEPTWKADNKARIDASFKRAYAIDTAINSQF
jgi:RecB family exonuclease